jgi:hypothetical protein
MTIFSYTIMGAIYNIYKLSICSGILSSIFLKCVCETGHFFKLITQISYITIVKLNSDFAQA